MNVPERLRDVARHLRRNCQSCGHQTGMLAQIAQRVSVVDMTDAAMELDRLALWLDNAGITEIPKQAKKTRRRKP